MDLCIFHAPGFIQLAKERALGADSTATDLQEKYPGFADWAGSGRDRQKDNIQHIELRPGELGDF